MALRAARSHSSGQSSGTEHPGARISRRPCVCRIMLSWDRNSLSRRRLPVLKQEASDPAELTDVVCHKRETVDQSNRRN
jgi:hypothetical protein